MHLRIAVLVACIAGCTATISLAQSSDDDDRESLRLESRTEQAASTVESAAASRLIVEQTNDFRQEQDLKSLEENQQLQETARYFARYMAENDVYGHRADGNRPAERAERFEYDYCLILENIAYQYDSRGFSSEELAEKFVNGWWNSAGHRKNMLDPDIHETGVAVAQSPKTGYWYGVQMFGRPQSARIEYEIFNDAGVEVSYSISERSFALPPRYTRTHTRCRPAPVSFEFPTNEGKDATIQPTDGSRFVIQRQDGVIAVNKVPRQETSTMD